jgi:hypothetical protein
MHSIAVGEFGGFVLQSGLTGILLAIACYILAHAIKVLGE